MYTFLHAFVMDIGQMTRKDTGRKEECQNKKKSRNDYNKCIVLLLLMSEFFLKTKGSYCIHCIASLQSSRAAHRKKCWVCRFLVVLLLVHFYFISTLSQKG